MDRTIVAPKQISAWDGTDGENWLKFRNLTKFNIMGSGIFDGQGQNWWTCKKKNVCTTAMSITQSSSVSVKGVTFKDSQKMHLRFSNVQDGTADGIQITAPSDSPNTDGIHVSESSNIVIANCDITTVKFTTLFQSLHHVVVGGEFDTSHSIEIASSVPSEFLLHSRAFETFKGHVPMKPADLTDAPDTAQPWPEEVASSNGTTFNVLSQGAVGDGVTDDTEAFLLTWDLACAVENGAMNVPSGYDFLVYPTLFNGSNCSSNLQLQMDGTIVAPKQISAWDGTDGENWLKFRNLTKFNIMGSGIFDGQGQNWWTCKKRNVCTTVPDAVSITQSSSVSVKGVTFKDSQKMHLRFSNVQDGTADGIQITAPSDSPNTDGIHVSESSNIVIANCDITTGDDCISIVSGSTNIQLTNIYCGPGCHGISVGGLGANNSAAFVSNITVQDCAMENNTNGLRIKTWQGGTGIAKNFVYKNVEMTNVANPIIIDQFYCPHQTTNPCSTSTNAVEVEDIQYINIHGTSSSSIAVKFNCSAANPCTKIFLQDINLVQASSGEVTISSCSNAYGSFTGTMTPPSCLNMD
ncbi:unnamed protein product [Sphagnum troendelagicum]